MSGSILTNIMVENRRAGRLTLVPFLPAAFPGAETFWTTLTELAEGGADIIEIGVPFSDPIADGPQVAEACRKALENGGSLDYIFRGLAERRGRFRCGLVLMGYVNPFLQYGWAEAAGRRPQGSVREILAASLEILAGKLAEAGVAGLIVPDLPLEESWPWLEALQAHDLDLIALVGPNTSLEKMRTYAAGGGGGYVYVVSVMGITGVRDGLPPGVVDTLLRARQAFDLPLALGFGLSSPRQLDNLPAEARPEAAVFGSALIRHLEAGGAARDFMALWRG
ncbi:MAG: tryptophan synthase subunit alpha [Candidatus Adiutrix sp.]|jgi:tryptophan synthase alpha chain|nr:tryptophan synthase subunit alpha [Candidatus Adiutrix sp.]